MKKSALSHLRFAAEAIDRASTAVALLHDDLDSLRTERDALRELVEGKFDGYDQDGEPILPRGWAIIDGGRYDELENTEAQVDVLRDELKGALGAWEDMSRLAAEHAQTIARLKQALSDAGVSETHVSALAGGPT